MNIRHILSLAIVGAMAVVGANRASAVDFRPNFPPMPVIQPIRPQPICVPVYRPVTISTKTTVPVIPSPRPVAQPAPRPIKAR